MSTEINVISKTQCIIVDPFSGSVAIINSGPMGPAGPGSGSGTEGPPGPEGPPGANGVSEKFSLIVPYVIVSALSPSSSFTWYAVDIGVKRGLVTRFTLHSSGTANFGFLIYSKIGGTGEQMFGASGMPSVDYTITWTVTGSLSIGSNQVYTGTGSGTAVIDLGVANMDVQIQIPDATSASLIWRWTDASNHLRLDLVVGSGTWWVYKVVSGTFTQLSTGSGVSGGATWRAVTSGSSITVYKDST